MSLPSMSMPNVPIPNVPMPNVSLPNVPMPKLPSVSSIVPKLSGLLAAGHSTVEVHPLGPMLRLPPARSPDEPAWEGIVIAGAQPGMPHLVEVEFPLDQRAVIGVSVLETDAAGTSVEVRSSGGFEVTPPTAAGEASSGAGRAVGPAWLRLLADHPASAAPDRQSVAPRCGGLRTGEGVGRAVAAAGQGRGRRDS
jgi:hypothetical protein